MRINEGERMPWGYGYAWRNWETLTSEAYIVPFNLIIRWLRKFWFILAGRPRGEYDKAYQRGYDKGFEAGKKNG